MMVPDGGEEKNTCITKKLLYANEAYKKKKEKREIFVLKSY